jgi:CHRD domain
MNFRQFLVFSTSLQLHFIGHPTMMTHRSFRLALCAAALLAVGACASPMMSKMATFNVPLSGANEVPPVTTPAKGMVTGKFDPATNLLTYTLTYEGLTGPATAAHFHGPAMAGQNAGVALGFKNPITSPQSGQAVLTPAQAADLMAGKWYVNVHTDANKGGELRGQMTAQ